MISRVGAPQSNTVPFGMAGFMRNVTPTGGVAPARAYIKRLTPAVLDGTVDVRRVFDCTMRLADIADGYRAVADRTVLKVSIAP